MNDKNVQRSLTYTALALPLGLFVGKVVELVLKSTNPSNVDITGVLAYLGVILWSGIIVVVVCWVLALIFAIVAHKKGEEPGAVRLAAILLIIIVMFSIVALLASKTTDNLIQSEKNSRVTQPHINR